jgi:adenosylcobinamide-phosphate synthase
MLELPHQVLVLWLAIAFDLLFGELPNAIHPVAWLGSIIALFRRHAPTTGRWKPFVAGMMFVIAGTCAVAFAGVLIVRVSSILPDPVALTVQALILKCTFSIRGLSRAGHSVQSALAVGDLAAARRLLSWHLVSRDTSSLSETEVAAATIESLSENASDSCVGPLLCYVVGGLPAALAYRFVNTCDAMLGYHDAEREWLGKAAARVDDLVNLVPSRLTAALILSCSAVFRSSAARAVQIWYRDHRLTQSPNAGHPMSAAAGVLCVQLEKIGHYRLGVGQRLPDAADIRRAQKMLWCTAAITIVTFSAILVLIQ